MWSRTQVHSHIVLVAKHARLCDIAPWATGIAHIVGLFQPDMREAVVDSALRRFFYKALFLPAAALGADTIGAQGDPAAGTAVDGMFHGKTFTCGIVAAAEGEFYDVELIFQQLTDDLDHSLNGHGFAGDDQTAFRIRSGKFSLECRAFHGVGRSAVTDSLFLIDRKNRREQGIILTQNQGVIEIFQHIPRNFFDLITGIDHVDAAVDGIFDLNGQRAGVTVKILCLSLEIVEAVGVLDVKCCDASRFFSPFFDEAIDQRGEPQHLIYAVVQ